MTEQLSSGDDSAALRSQVVEPEFLPRKQLSEFLTRMGYPIRPSQLAKLAVTGGGPPYQRFNRWAIYKPATALEWARSELSEPATRASAARDHEVRGGQQGDSLASRVLPSTASSALAPALTPRRWS